MAKKEVLNMSFTELVALTDSEKDDLLKTNMGDKIKAQFLNATVNLNEEISSTKVYIKNHLLNIQEFDLKNFLVLEEKLEKSIKTKVFMEKRFKVLFPGEELNITNKTIK